MFLPDIRALLVGHSTRERGCLQAENAALRPLIEWLAAELPDYDATVKMHTEARALLATGGEHDQEGSE